MKILYVPALPSRLHISQNRKHPAAIKKNRKMNVIIFPHLESQEEIPSVDLSLKFFCFLLVIIRQKQSISSIVYLFEIGDPHVDPCFLILYNPVPVFIRPPIHIHNHMHEMIISSISNFIYKTPAFTLGLYADAMITSARSAAPSLSLICIHYVLIDNIERQVNRELFSNGILTVDDIFEKKWIVITSIRE